MVLPTVAKGDPHVAAHNNERAAINNLETAVADLAPSYESVPAGSTFTLYFDDDNGWPDRPTDRTDVVFVWTNLDDSNPPTNGVVGVDKWDVTAV